MADLRYLVLLVLAAAQGATAQKTAAQMTSGREPTLEILPESIRKAVGEGVYVSCTAMVDDTELVTEMSWTAPNGRQIINNVDDTVSTAEDGTEAKLDLIISKLREQDVGEYTCSATYAGNQKLEAKVLVESFRDIDFGDTPTHQTLLIGQEGKVKCTPTAKPSPHVDWFKNGVSLKNDDSHIIQQDGILITEVTEADEGTYRCRARVLDLGSIKQVNIQVEVHIPPVINQPPQDLKGKETESIKFECSATGKPAPYYSWVDKDNRPLEDLEGYHVDSVTGDLTIVDLKPEQSGEYRCTASNSAGEDFKTAFLQVLTKPRVEEYLNLTMPVGSEAEMRCVVTGSPEPLVIFKKESEANDFVSGINADDRISVTQESDDQGRQVGILKIRDVARSDDGLYTCTAQSEGGVTQRWGHITVEFKPTFEDQGQTEQWSWEKAPVNLTCLATSIPNATIEWYLRGHEIDLSDQNLQRKELGPLGVLRVNPVSSAYFGIYTCEATNTLGTATLDLELKEAHTPGPIASAKVEKKTATTVTWSLVDPADNGGLPIQSYIMEYRESDQSWEGAKREIWTKGSSYTVDNLTPQTTYVFRFAARSKAGDGEWGGEKSEEMPRHAQPEEPLIFADTNKVVEIPYPSHYDLQWQVPLDNGREIDHFQIVYYQVKEKAGKWEAVGDKTTREVKYPGTTTYKIEGLHVNSHYKIELRAHNDIGYSTPAEAIIKTANGPQPDTVLKEDGLGTGIIVAIIVIVVVVVLVVVDISCFFTRNAGLTATIAGKQGSNDKDKEAMLEDGKNASADTFNEESREDTKPTDGKLLPEKVPQTPTEKNSDIKLEKEVEDIQEGNGQMKTQKEEDLKPEQEEDSIKKVKESTEPTETTPMIQRHSLQGTAILRQEALPLRAASQSSVFETSEAIKMQDRRNNLTKPPPQKPPGTEATRPTKPVIVEVLMKDGSKEDPRSLSVLRPEGVSSNVRYLDKIGKRSPQLDQSSDDSVYDDSLYAKLTNGGAINASSSLDTTRPPPPLPRRNTVTQYSHFSQSHEILSDPLATHSKEDVICEHLQTLQYMPGSRDELNTHGIPQHSLGSCDILDQTPQKTKDSFGSRDALKLEREEPTNRTNPQPHHAVRNSDALNQPQTFAHANFKPSSMTGAKETVTQASPRTGYMSDNREALNPGNSESLSLMKSSKELNDDHGTQSLVFDNSKRLQDLSRMIQDSVTAGRPPKTPSISSSSTMYQPLDAGYQQYPTRTAYRIAPYDDPGCLARPLPLQSHRASQGLEMQPPKTRSNNCITPSTTAHGTRISERPRVQAPSPFVPRVSTQGEEKFPKTGTTFRDTSQHPSHSLSVDHLDGPVDTQWPFSTQLSSDRWPSVMSTAKSLNSLLDSSSISMRSYGQPTLL